MAAKYKLGDKVLVNPIKCPCHIKGVVYHRAPRRIVFARYDKACQHTLYFLGYNRRGADITAYAFRAEQLNPYERITRRHRHAVQSISGKSQ